MARQQTQALKSIAGTALAGPALFIVVGNLDGAVAQLKGLLSTPVHGLGLLSSVILAASIDQQQLRLGLLQSLVSFWPSLLVMAGALLLRDSFTESLATVAACARDFKKSGR